jgi:murein L,D-transpeptidase YafK
MRHLACKLVLILAGLVGLGATAPAMADVATTPPANVQRVTYTPASPVALPTADRIVVRKSQRRLELLRKGEVLRSYKVALGLQPVGHKERSGDFRTPEGRYLLSRRNPRSDFFLSIQISYPNEADARNAKDNGWEPGGSIMIHGLPNVLKRDLTYYQTRDWTDGCIAVSNSDMVEIWLLTHDNTPIEILP